MIDERITMKLEVLRGETMGQLNKMFRQKVQLEEQLEENEVNIHYNRGILDAYEKFQEVVKEIGDADRLDEARRKREEKLKSQLEGGIGVNRDDTSRPLPVGGDK